MMRDTHNHACAIFPTRCVVNHRLDFRGFIGLLGVRGFLFSEFFVRRCCGTPTVMPARSEEHTSALPSLMSISYAILWNYPYCPPMPPPRSLPISIKCLRVGRGVRCRPVGGKDDAAR